MAQGRHHTLPRWGAGPAGGRGPRADGAEAGRCAIPPGVQQRRQAPGGRPDQRRLAGRLCPAAGCRAAACAVPRRRQVQPLLLACTVSRASLISGRTSPPGACPSAWMPVCVPALATLRCLLAHRQCDASTWLPAVVRASLPAGPLATRATQLQGTCKCMAFDSRGTALALGREDGSLQLLEWPSLEARFHSRCCPAPCRQTAGGCLLQEPSGLHERDSFAHLASNCRGRIATCKPAPARSGMTASHCLSRLDCRGEHGLREAVRDLDFSRAHKDCVLAVCCDDGSCSLWDTQTGSQLSRLELPQGAPWARLDAQHLCAHTAL